MPKVNTTFHECPHCRNIKFEEKTIAVFAVDPDDRGKPGPTYSKNIEYVCISCGYRFDKEINRYGWTRH